MGLKDCIFEIPSHNIFKLLQQNENILNEEKNLINISTIKNNELFLWNENTFSINVICLKYSYLDNVNNNPFKFYQILNLNHPPSFSVEHILCNQNEGHIAIYGKKGICIVTKPTLIWSNNDSSNIFKSHLCKTYLVDEHFFSTNDSLSSFKWHPGNQYEQKFVFLASNSLRVYSISNVNIPQTVINLSENNLSFSFSGISTRQILGEICVSFDFGDSIDVEEVKIDEKIISYKKMWPIYVLFENGDVHEVLVDFNNSDTTNILRGPLLMFPPAEDNYGSDACSILYISSDPTVLVIATQEGKIYNCLLLPNDEDTEAPKIMKFFKVSALPSLYVQERIDLELYLDQSTDIYTPLVQMQLYYDNLCSNRYYVYHPTGLYSVFMPWLTKITEFIFSDEYSVENLDFCENSVVKHLFCSKPIKSSNGEFLIGFARNFDHIIGCHVICLTNNYQCHILRNIYVNDPPLTIEMDDGMFEMKTSSNDLLLNRIYTIFNKKTSIPYISGIDNAPSEIKFQLLCKITEMFREEYIQRFGLARIELEKNVQIILINKKNQEDELKLIEDEMSKINILRKRVENKILLISQTQKSQKIRIEDVSLRLYKTISMLTNAEENIKNNLNSMNVEMSDLKLTTRQLKQKDEKLRSKSLEILSPNIQTSKKFPDDEQKVANVLTCLTKEMEDISRLLNQTKRLKAILDI